MEKVKIILLLIERMSCRSTTRCHYTSHNDLQNICFTLHQSDFEDYIDQLISGCEIAPSFIEYLILCFAVEAEREDQEEVYWQLWSALSQTVQEIAIDIAQDVSKT